jgi:hypothetical protein
MILSLIASTLAPYALTIELAELSAIVGAIMLASEPEETEPVTERSPVTIRSGAYLASGLTVQIAA